MPSALPIVADCCDPCACIGCQATNLSEIVTEVVTEITGIGSGGGASVPRQKAFKTVADLRANTIYFDDVIYHLLGTFAEGDTEGRVYWFDTEWLEDDNGSSVIKPDDIDPASPGRYKELM